MSTASVATVTKMLESLPVPLQDRVVEHLQEYIEDLRDELRWNVQFRNSQSQLAATARNARKQIAEGLAEPMDISKL